MKISTITLNTPLTVRLTSNSPIAKFADRVQSTSTFSLKNLLGAFLENGICDTRISQNRAAAKAFVKFITTLISANFPSRAFLFGTS